MKRILYVIILLMTIIYPLQANAQEFFTLEELKREMPSNWCESYVDKYGREIEVNVDIQIYGEDTAPVLKLAYSGYTLIRERWEKDVKIRENDLFISISRNNPHRTITSGKMKNSEKKHIAFSSYSQSLENDRVYGQKYGNDLTINEAFSCLEVLLDRLEISSDKYMYSPTSKLEILTKVDKESEKNITPAFYVFEFWRQYRGLPVLAHASDGFFKRGWPVYRPRIDFSISNSQEYQIIVRDLDEMEIMEDDIPLCSVTKIIEEVENEIKDGHVRKVFEVQFGYALYNDPDFPENTRSSYDAKCYYAVPSWVVNCIYIANPKEEYSFNEKNEEGNGERETEKYKSLVFNAQTGKLLDPQDRSKKGWGNADYMGFVAWNEI